MLDTLFSNPLFFVLSLVSIIIAIAIHEFAHAKTRCGHDKKWREFFIQIGGGGKTHASRTSLMFPLFKYKLTCPECGREVYKHKKGKDRSCGICSGGKYNPKYKMVWTINENYNTTLSA